MNTVKIVTPHAAVIVWNYRDRIGPDGQTLGVNTIDQVVISTISLLSISTTKNKSSPSGTFNIELAPTKNWVRVITPGSWMCVLMSQDKIQKQDLQTANPKMVKFFGRVDSVRAMVSVDQETGARMTRYSMVGSDWAQIFNTALYVDPASRDPDESAIGQAGRFLYNNYADQLSKGDGLPSSTDNIKELIALWGHTNSTFKAINDDFASFAGIGKPEITFDFPKEVIDFFGFTTEGGGDSTSLVSLLHLKHGALQQFDTYNEHEGDVGVIKPDSIFGTHSFWQVLTDNCNHILNELITDIRWEDGEPQLTLYQRIKPFCKTDFHGITAIPGSRDKLGPDQDILGPLISRFENIRNTTVPLENILSFNAGTNWRDKYNYAELQIDQSLQEDVRSVQVKLQSAIFHEDIFAREGFRPMIAATKYLPSTDDDSFDPLSVAQWKFLLKEWYFDTHNMLNGSVTFIGVNDYIQVGDNILMDATIMGQSNNTNMDNINHKGSAFILAHVESVSHNFSVEPNGARSFFTTINFVRGIITDSRGKQFSSGRIDLDASSMSKSQEKNSANVFGTSGPNDPDPLGKDGS